VSVDGISSRAKAPGEFDQARAEAAVRELLIAIG